MKNNSGIDGPGRKDNYLKRINAANLAEERKCPNCNRKNAMVKADYYDSGHPMFYCRWCGYTKSR